jgi:CRP/FNR family transcriptional regulator, cyclic AMP receptor protein
MNLQTECQILQNIPMFRDVDIAKLRLLAMSGNRITFEAGDTIFHQHEPSNAVYVLLEGAVDIILENENGKRVKLAQLSGNEMFGETGVLCDQPRTATVEAASHLTVIEIDRHTFNEVVRDVPQLALAIARELAHRLERMNRQFADKSKG